MFKKDGFKCAMMTGSGSCVFALTKDAKKALNAGAKFLVSPGTNEEIIKLYKEGKKLEKTLQSYKKDYSKKPKLM